ncbi:hypothetical protein HYH03_008408 [Edaphochlamys debaryana]|uniref:Uncharacterized protein n=1 Tax=Edaphochlamys debaryana TaxID=47281 RepID=A0A836BXY6_9CHLO|nr:hypothetical protein HYH03_008408 [Edaphochlamys debaryana]|eukprot:KAG2493271.1 hypothetical protein HYH03_008408 [Edaphochlamys debaryana]
MALCMRSSVGVAAKAGRSSTLSCAPALRSGVRRASVTAQAFFGRKSVKEQPKKVVRETVVPEPAYNVQLGLLGIAGVSAYYDNYILAGFTGLLGAFLIFQATRINFVFDDEALSVLRSGQESENVVVGGANRWPYESFINWEMWWPGFPILVYFKENQTKPEGQIHFFPIIFNGKQLYDVMVERCGPSQNSGPKN